MRVTINRREQENKEKTGFFSSKTTTAYIVQAIVEFSETEKATIRKYNLGSTVLFHERFDNLIEQYKANNLPYKEEAVSFSLTIDKLIKEPFQRGFATPMLANEFENKVKGEILPALKQLIEGNTTTSAEPKSETFEL